jgi:cyclase
VRIISILTNVLMIVTTALSGAGYLETGGDDGNDSRRVEVDDPGFTIERIGNGVYAAVGGDDEPAISNAGFIVGSNGVVVVDTFEDVTPARELLLAIRKITNLPIRFVVNTHYHFDHVGGNGVFAEAGATILAHRNVRVWERTENLKFFAADPKLERKAYVESLVVPDMVYSDSVDIYLGERIVQVRHVPGHTGGDSVVIVPRSRDDTTDIVFAGDTIWQKHVPNLIDASTAPWIQTLDKLLTEHPAATFVPGHGELATANDVRDFRNYIETIRTEIAKAQSDGNSGPELVKVVKAKLKASYGTWGFFDYFIEHSIEETVAELKGKKKLPLPAKN